MRSLPGALMSIQSAMAMRHAMGRIQRRIFIPQVRARGYWSLARHGDGFDLINCKDVPDSQVLVVLERVFGS